MQSTEYTFVDDSGKICQKFLDDLQGAVLWEGERFILLYILFIYILSKMYFTVF